MSNGAATLENSLVGAQKIKQLPYAPGILFQGTHKGNGNMCPHKNLHTNIYSNIIHDSKKVKESKNPSIDE